MNTKEMDLKEKVAKILSKNNRESFMVQAESILPIIEGEVREERERWLEQVKEECEGLTKVFKIGPDL